MKTRANSKTDIPTPYISHKVWPKVLLGCLLQHLGRYFLTSKQLIVGEFPVMVWQQVKSSKRQANLWLNNCTVILSRFLHRNQWVETECFPSCQAQNQQQVLYLLFIMTLIYWLLLSGGSHSTNKDSSGKLGIGWTLTQSSCMLKHNLAKANKSTWGC